MSNISLLKKAIVSALGVTVYVTVVAWFMNNAKYLFGDQPSWFNGVLILLLFIVSACITGSLVLLRPAMMYLADQKKEGLTLFAYTVVCLAAFALAVGVVLALVK